MYVFTYLPDHNAVGDTEGCDNRESQSAQQGRGEKHTPAQVNNNHTYTVYTAIRSGWLCDYMYYDIRTTIHKHIQVMGVYNIIVCIAI